MIFQGIGLWSSRLAQAVYLPVRTATKRASGGKSANKNTAGRRLGPKKGEGEFVQPGQILWRQRGTSWYPGENAGIGREHTIYAREPGFVRYYRDPFHAKRRFIGVALGKDDRLPTPHFSPRRRRFGYTPIPNGEIAKFEEEYLTRKETMQVAAMAEVLSKRESAQQRRLAVYTAAIESKVPGLTPEQVAAQADRLLKIYQYLSGAARTVEEARAIVDKFALDDLSLDARLGRLESSDVASLADIYQSTSAQVDAKLTFSSKRDLIDAWKSPESFNTELEAAKVEIKELTLPYLDGPDGTPNDVVNKVLEILNRPVFSPSDVSYFKSRYLRRPLPVLLSETDKAADLEKRATDGIGEIRAVWDYEKRRVRQWYIPPGAKLLF